MKNFSNLVLCDYHDENLSVHVRASMNNGALHLSCQDLGPKVESFWGDSDYEYWYSFTQEETEKLLKAINGEENPEEALLKHFSGISGTRQMSELCKKEGIVYSFFSYA